MRAAVFLLLALCAQGAFAWHFHHDRCHKPICGAGWDRHFAIKGHNFIDPAKGQFAQKAFNTVLVQTTAAAIRTGALPKGTTVADYKLYAGCYESIIPGTLKSKQYAGEYQFAYSVAYKLPGDDHMHWVTVVANSYNRRHFPWFEMIEAYLW
ncbi:hypothetical protein ABPG75_006198 [Micractinium tetrahymenae]